MSEQNYYQQILDMLEQGMSQKTIVNNLGVSFYTVSTAVAFYKVHGKEEYIKYFITKDRKKFTRLEMSNIVELCYTKRLGAYKVAIIFKTPVNTLYSLLCKRKDLGVPLVEGTTIAQIPKNLKLKDLAFLDQKNRSK